MKGEEITPIEGVIKLSALFFLFFVPVLMLGHSCKSEREREDESHIELAKYPSSGQRVAIGCERHAQFYLDAGWEIIRMSSERKRTIYIFEYPKQESK